MPPGVLPAQACARYLEVPMVFAREKRPITMDSGVLEVRVNSLLLALSRLSRVHRRLDHHAGQEQVAHQGFGRDALWYVASVSCVLY
jgi:adenine/guanine phosphoribosyltransferase-like PRPP-binding protein